MDNREKMIVDNLSLVRYVCKKINCPEHLFEDCVQEGTIGLIKAVDGFDPSLGYSFSTYAYVHIKNRVFMYLRDECNLIKTSRSMKMLASKICKLYNDGMERDEICDKLKITGFQYDEALFATEINSLDVVLDEDTGATLIDFIADDEVEEPIEIIEEYIVDIVDRITKDESETIKEMYKEHICSRMWDEPAGQVYLGKKYGMSQPQVGRVIRRLNSKFKTEFHRR